MMAIAGTLVMSGCGDDGGTDPDPKPTLNFLGGSEYVSDNTTLPVNTNFKVGIEASHESRIDKLEISVSYNGGPRVSPVGCNMCDSTINSKTLSAVYNGVTNNIAGKEKWYFSVVDKNGNKTEKSFTITTTAPAKPISFISSTMGNQNAATVGSSLTLDVAFDVLTLQNAKDNSQRVDVIYVQNVDVEILCAPSSQSAGDLLTGSSGTYAVTTWPTRNATLMRRIAMTDVEFEAMSDNAELVAALSDMSSASDEVKNIQEGDVLVVDPVSTGGLPCLILVESINVDNTMTIKIAVEQQ